MANDMEQDGAPAPSPAPSPRLQEIFDGFQQKLANIEALDQKIDDKVLRLRRKMVAQMSQTSPYRESHLRVFCSHLCSPMPTTVDNMNVPRPPSFDWTLQLEGKLLIGHLDHAHAKEYDKKVGYKAPPTSHEKSENDDESTAPLNFTHFFHKISCQMSTVYMPRRNPMAVAIIKKKPTTKKSRRSSKSGVNKAAAEDQSAVDPKTLQQSATTQFHWTNNMTHDAEAMHIRYPSPHPPAHSHQIHSVVATIQLYPKRSTDQVFQVSQELSTLFPNHGPEARGTTAGMKRSSSEMTDQQLPIPLTNEIEIPNVLTLPDIIEAFFIYIQDRTLNDETEPMLIICDERLREILQVPSFQFSELQKILVSRQLIRVVTNEPIHITYIMKPETAVEPPPPPLNEAAAATTPADEVPDRMPVSVLQLDMDVAVPNFMLPRCRNLMRRMSRRDADATNARHRVRYLYANRKGVSEEDARRVVQQATDNLAIENMEIHQACAQLAAKGSSAKKLFDLDAKICSLMSVVEERQAAALTAWGNYAKVSGAITK